MYYAVCDDKEGLRLMAVESALSLSIGEEIDADFNLQIIEAFSEPKAELGKIPLTAGAFAHSLVSGEISMTGIEELDAVTKKMKGKLLKCAQIFARKLAYGTPIIVRFHNDADGSSGAYSLYKSMMKTFHNPFFAATPKIYWKMHKNVIYSDADAGEDMLTVNNYESLEKPLLVAIDFGTSQDTNAGLAALKDSFDIIWLDHHPLEENANVKELANYVSPWQFGGDSSYTAGFLACQFSKFFWDREEMGIEDASLIGDYSKHAKNTEDGKRLALVLDLLTSDKSVAFGTRNYLTPSEIEQVLNDRTKTAELYSYALSRMEEATDSALKSARKYAARDGEIYVVDFDSVREPASTDRFPLPGRFASRLLSRIDQISDKPKVLILHFGRFISMRVSNNAKNIVDVSQIARSMRETDDNIESGGGHSSAASIKMVDDSQKKETINAIIAVLKEKL